MGLFNKEGDYIDYTLLQRKGLVSSNAVVDSDEDGYMQIDVKNSEGDVVNPFSGVGVKKTENNSPLSSFINSVNQKENSGQENSLGSFFGSEQGSNSSNAPGNIVQTTMQDTSDVSNPLGGFFSNDQTQSEDYFSQNSNIGKDLEDDMDNLELNALKIKIEDLEYKLERALEKIDNLEKKG